MALPKVKGKAETILEIALALALLRPDWKSLLPSQITNGEVGVQNTTDPYLAVKQTSADAYSPLNEFTSWEGLGDKVQFSNDLIAMLNTVLGDNASVGSCDESGYSSENPSSPSASSCSGSVSFEMPLNHFESSMFEDQSYLGATGYTPPREDNEKGSVWDLEDFVDLSSIETPPVDKQPWNWPMNLEVELDNSYDESFYNTKESSGKDFPMLTNASRDYSDNKVSVDDDILLQTPLDFHSQNSYDPYSIDFALKGESIDSSEPDVDFDSMASYLGELDLPLDILDTSAVAITGLTSGNGTEVPPTGSVVNTTMELVNVSSQVLAIKREPEAEEDLEENKVNPKPASTQPKREKRRSQRNPLSMQLDLTEDEIVDLPVVQFNEFVESLPQSQAALARDIRRRGKNKEAARVCRKRKMDTIASLEEEIALIASKKDILCKENKLLDDENSDLKQQIGGLYNYVFASLRDENGQPLSPSEHSLLHAANGCLYLVPNISNSKKSLKVK